MSTKQGSNWRVLSASVVGKGHERNGRSCDDHHAWWRIGSGLVIALADGAGSAPRGGQGAREATRAIDSQSPRLVDAAGHDDPDQLKVALAETLQIARGRVEMHASADSPLVNLATTLTVAVVGTSLVGVVHVGDGAVVIESENGLRLIAAERGQYINETDFLTGEQFLEAAIFDIQSSAEVSAIAAITDGLQLLALGLPACAPHAPFFDPLFAYARRPDSSDVEVEDFLNSPRVNARTDDDKTLILAVRVDH